MGERFLTSRGVDLDRAKDATRAMWARGNYPRIAELIRPVARTLVDACAISAGQEILDVAAGTGNVAVLAAEEGAMVVASDITPEMVEQGSARSAEEGVDIEWVEADAEALPFGDASFDCVTSCFGAMFAPRPDVVSSELFRVVRPGGTVGMANWAPDGYFGRASALSQRYQPLPEGVPRPTGWGDEEVVRARFEGLAGSVELTRRTVPFEFPSLEAMWEVLTSSAGPQVATREAMDPGDWEALRLETLEMATEFARPADGSVVVDSEYLLVVARRRG